MTTLPDNLISKLTRAYIDNRTFTDDNGKQVQYDRGVIEFMVKDEPVQIEFKLDKKDIMLLRLADSAQRSNNI